MRGRRRAEAASEATMNLRAFAARFVNAVEHGSGESGPTQKSEMIAEIIGRNLGIDKVTRILGEGSYGIAAAISRQLALKLTSDPTEVEASAAIAGEIITGVVRVEGAWFVDDISVWNASVRMTLPVGVILVERLSSVGLGSKRDDEMLFEATYHAKRRHDVMPDQLDTLPRDEARRRLESASYDLAEALRQSALGEGAAGEEGALLALGESPLASLADGVSALAERGIYVVDLHPRNVGYSEEDGEWKMFDLGVSSAPPRTAQPVLSGIGPRGMAGLLG